MSDKKQHEAPRKVQSSATAAHSVDGDVANYAVQEQEQLQAAAEQRLGKPKEVAINEGGRTNESGRTHNPEGAVHGVPLPSLKGTWR